MQEDIETSRLFLKSFNVELITDQYLVCINEIAEQSLLSFTKKEYSKQTLIEDAERFNNDDIYVYAVHLKETAFFV